MLGHGNDLHQAQHNLPVSICLGSLRSCYSVKFSGAARPQASADVRTDRWTDRHGQEKVLFHHRHRHVVSHRVYFPSSSSSSYLPRGMFSIIPGHSLSLSQHHPSTPRPASSAAATFRISFPLMSFLALLETMMRTIQCTPMRENFPHASRRGGLWYLL